MCTIHIPSTVEGDKKWNLVSEKQEMEKEIIDQNMNHLSASASTPLGKGESFNQLHDKNKRRSMIQKLLRGTSGWRHNMKEVEEFIEELKTIYDVENLESIFQNYLVVTVYNLMTTKTF